MSVSIDTKFENKSQVTLEALNAYKSSLLDNLMVHSALTEEEVDAFVAIEVKSLGELKFFRRKTVIRSVFSKEVGLSVLADIYDDPINQISLVRAEIFNIAAVILAAVDLQKTHFPRFEHDARGCVYVGRYNEYDLWVGLSDDPDFMSFIGRLGNEPHEYTSFNGWITRQHVDSDHVHPSCEAYRRYYRQHKQEPENDKEELEPSL